MDSEKKDINIIVLFYGEIFPINCKPTYTIKRLKIVMYMKKFISIVYQILLFNDKVLEDDKTCEFYNITNESKLTLLINEKIISNDDLNITIKHIESSINIEINAKPKDTIKKIKELIREKQFDNKPIEEFKLVYRNQELEDDRALYTYNIIYKELYGYQIYLDFAPIDAINISVKSKYDIFGPYFLLPSSKIKELKNMIEYDQNIYSLYTEDNKKLEDESTLSENNFTRKTTLKLVFEPKEGVILIISSDFSKYLFIEFKKSDYIIDVKKEIEKHLQINHSSQILYYKGNKLIDDKTIICQIIIKFIKYNLKKINYKIII